MRFRPGVPRGCKGLWSEALPPGDCLLQRRAYDVTVVDTRLQSWEYCGGFDRQFILISAENPVLQGREEGVAGI